MTNCFMGKILWVDLSTGAFNEEEVPEDLYRQYLGGYGLAAKYIYKNMPPKADPLGAESILAFFPGLLTGTIAPLTGRYMVAGKSPLTGTWGDSHCGGFFGPEIKRCGYDGILIKGMADIPKILTIIDGEKNIVDASDLWGLDAVETENKLNEKFAGAKFASIGQAGEKLSLISGIVNDKGRIAARSGLGAVMGSKKLKAIVLKGNQSISIADKITLTDLTRQYNEGIKSAEAGSIQLWRDLGTPWMNDVVAKTGDAPIKNWGGTSAEDFPMENLSKLTGIEIVKYKDRKFGCFGCPVQCGALMKIPDLDLEETHRPEYETCASFGHLLLNDDLKSIFIVNDLCNRAGLDTISAGGTVAFAIECFENGILGLDDTEGLKLKWGNSEAIIELVKKVINREGIGDILADGSKIAAEKIGKGSAEYAIHSMGQELGMHSPKYYKSMGMSFAFDPTPGRHTSGSLDMMAGGPMLKPDGLFPGFSLPKKFKRPGEERNEALKLSSALWQTTSCVGLCQFAYFFQQYPLTDFIKSATGWDINMDELLRAGVRIQTLRQAFTVREGVDIAKNKIPERTVGVDYKADFKGYCEAIGWNPENGYPTEQTLSELGLEFVIKDLY
ncbi:MAG: aldehyde ferredoxin oxidoreductase family protein [Candidatus Hodarchaeota archaeon]